MASYSSYKKVSADSIDGRVVSADKLQPGAGMPRDVLWVYSERGMKCQACANNSNCCCQACGKCCEWTVPNNVSTATFEIWSGGGGGPGVDSCHCWAKSIGGAGGNYAVKTVDTKPGCQYTVCAGGSSRCSRRVECTGGIGCKSFVTGYNLNNFCAVGGCGGWACSHSQAWDPRTNENCANCGVCGFYGADFGMMGSTGFKSGEGRVGSSACACNGRDAGSGAAPYIGRTVWTHASDSVCTCGCFVNWPAGGGMAGTSDRCGTDSGRCCAVGSGQGGSGIVKITYS